MFHCVDSKIVGVLIDFDLAQDITKESRSKFDRTGIPFYMAIDLLGDDPAPHFARHDLESMFWVTVWFTFRYENGRELQPRSPRPLDDWFASGRVLEKIKLGFLVQPGGGPTPPFQNLHDTWIDPLASLFLDGIRALDKYLGGVKEYQQAPYLGSKPVFGPDQIFYDDTTAWMAFWQILSPTNPTDFKDACNGARLGFWPFDP